MLARPGPQHARARRSLLVASEPNWSVALLVLHLYPQVCSMESHVETHLLLFCERIGLGIMLVRRVTY